MPMDLANYLNETMLDNAHPSGFGIKLYLKNCMSRSELKEMATIYLQTYYDKYLSVALKESFKSSQDFSKKHLDTFISQTYYCALLNNMYWGIWCIAMMQPADFADPSAFYYEALKARI